MGDLAELDLHALAVGKLDAEAFAVGDIGLRDLQAALGKAEPTHAMGKPRGHSRLEIRQQHYQMTGDAKIMQLGNGLWRLSIRFRPLPAER